MKNKVFTAMLIVAAFIVGLAMNNGQQEEVQASMDLSALYSQLDTMQAKLDNLSMVCQRECDASSEYSLPDFKATEFVTVTEVVTMTEVVTVTDHMVEVIYTDRIITETVYVELPCGYDAPTCEEPEVEGPKSDTPKVEQPKDDPEEEPKVEQPSDPEVEEPKSDEPVPETEDTPKKEKKSDCNQGVGNGDEGCDPGNSNHNQPSNDEATSDGKVPGSPGRQHNTNGNPEDKSSNKSDQPKAAKPDKVKDDKGKKNG